MGQENFSKEMKGKFSQFKKSIFSLFSGIVFVLIIWLLFFGKIKVSELLTPLIDKIPKDKGMLTQLTEQVLGAAISAAKGGKVKKVAEEGSQLFESSQYAAPARDIRENAKQKVDEVIESLKKLPEQELKVIKLEIYKRWFSDVATESANQRFDNNGRN